MPAVRLTVIAVQRAVLDKLIADANPLAFYEHLHLAVDDAPRRGAAIIIVAATLAVRAHQLAVDVMGLNWHGMRGGIADNSIPSRTTHRIVCPRVLIITICTDCGVRL